MALLCSIGYANLSPIRSATTTNQPIAGDPPALAKGVYGQPPTSELDEIVGDTVHVYLNWRDMQHNSTLGRMIAVDEPALDGSQLVHFTWCNRTSAAAPSQVYYRSATLLSNGNVTWGSEVNVNSPNWGGYPLLAADNEGDVPFVGWHGGDGGTGYLSFVSTPNLYVPNVFNAWPIPTIGAVTIWPHMAGGQTGGDYYTHTVLNEYDPDNLLEDGLYYNRAVYDPLTGSMSNDTPGGANQVLVTDIAMNLSNAVAVSPDGSHIAIGQTVGRYNLFGEGDQSSQYNNDILVWESTDGGDNWNWGTGNATNITSFLPPNPNALPDTTEANQDTMRAYTEVDLAYSSDNTLHAVFSLPGYDFYRGTITYTDRLYYWNNDHQMYTQIADGTFWNYSYSAVWERIVGNAQLSIDEDLGVIWCAFVQYGQPGDTTGAGIPIDASDERFKATDIWVTASPNNGLHWATPVNVTNTRNLGTDLLPYETESEREMTLALDAGGDNLHLFYTLDYDPGIAVPSNSPEGDPTENYQVYHVINKQDLIAEFEAGGEWVRNYPMHVDESGFFVSQDDWEWNGFWNPDGGQGAPAQLTLTGINTTVGPNGGEIAYSAHLETFINQAFQDVDYWTMVELPNGQEMGPLFMFTFNVPAFADMLAPWMTLDVPGGAPAGTYIFTGHVGFHPNSVISDSFTFNKIAAGTDSEGEFVFDPAEWKSSGEWPGVASDDPATLTPYEFELNAAWPNPFNAATSFSITLPQADYVQVAVFDVLGREVVRLVDGPMIAGSHTFTFDGSEFASGVYFLRVSSVMHGDQIQKLILLK